jgi:hypothetical protein
MRFDVCKRLGAAGTFGLGFVAAAHGQYNTVGAYDATPTAGMPIIDVASNTLVNGITLANFTTMISGAYTANTGGDLDFEPGNNWTGATIGMNVPVTAKYGVSLSNSLSISRTDLTSGATGWRNNNNSTFWSSASNYVEFTGAGNATLSFGSGLLDVGITLLPLAGANVQAKLTATMNDLSTVTTSLGSTGPPPSSAVFFGISAPSGKTITSLSFVDNGLGRYDDLAFAVAPSPEPISVVLLGAGGLALLRRRKV